MNIIITGGARFNGSHVYDKHRKARHAVFCLDNLVNRNLMNIKSDLNDKIAPRKKAA